MRVSNGKRWDAFAGNMTTPEQELEHTLASRGSPRMAEALSGTESPRLAEQVGGKSSEEETLQKKGNLP